MYVVVPDMPANLVSAEALKYSGAVTFSQRAAWFIHLEKNSRMFAALVVEFMNGDGTTVSGQALARCDF
jgi:hypothetical protein